VRLVCDAAGLGVVCGAAWGAPADSRAGDELARRAVGGREVSPQRRRGSGLPDSGDGESQVAFKARIAGSVAAAATSEVAPPRALIREAPLIRFASLRPNSVRRNGRSYSTPSIRVGSRRSAARGCLRGRSGGHARTGHAVALSSGMVAPHMAFLLVGVGPSNRVRCSPLPLVASAGPIVYVGADHVFADAGPGSRDLDVDLVEERLRRLGRCRCRTGRTTGPVPRSSTLPPGPSPLRNVGDDPALTRPAVAAQIGPAG
jgi:hypothetical protein